MVFFAPTNDLRVVEWMVGFVGCRVGSFVKGFRVDEWMFVWTGCRVSRLTNGFRLVVDCEC